MGLHAAISSLLTGRFTITKYHVITELSALGNYNETKWNSRPFSPWLPTERRPAAISLWFVPKDLPCESSVHGASNFLELASSYLLATKTLVLGSP